MDGTRALEERFRRLFYDEYRHVLGYALRRTRNLADAQDAVAETFAVAWRRIRDAPGDDVVRPWLYGIAFRTIANQRRAQLRLGAVRSKLGSQPSPPNEIEDEVGRRQEWQEVRAALAHLPGDEQEILRLAAWEGLSHREIGTVLGCSVNAAAIRLHRARRHLLDALAKESERSGHSLDEGHRPTGRETP